MARKTLGQHNIPTLQTIVIDHAAGMVKLSTTLARLGEGESLRIGRALPLRKPGRTLRQSDGLNNWISRMSKRVAS